MSYPPPNGYAPPYNTANAYNNPYSHPPHHPPQQQQQQQHHLQHHQYQHQQQQQHLQQQHPQQHQQHLPPPQHQQYHASAPQNNAQLAYNQQASQWSSHNQYAINGYPNLQPTYQQPPPAPVPTPPPVQQQQQHHLQRQQFVSPSPRYQQISPQSYQPVQQYQQSPPAQQPRPQPRPPSRPQSQPQVQPPLQPPLRAQVQVLVPSQLQPQAQSYLQSNNQSYPPPHPQSHPQSHFQSQPQNRPQSQTPPQPKVQPQSHPQPSPPAPALPPPEPQPEPFTPPTHVNLASIMAPRPPVSTTLDIPQLLIPLAEEYFSAAHQLAPTISLSMSETETDAYSSLITTGLGCLAMVLKTVKLAPRVEAKIRLRYAGVLFDETENTMEAETTLSHGIALCERNRYFDLQYAMQFLLARIMAVKNPKAALKALEKHSSDAQTYQHYSWVYAFRLLRASYLVQTGSQVNLQAAIHDFRIVSEVATQQNDYAIYMAVSLLEAMGHMRSTASDSLQNVQTALANAWKYQFSVGNIPQLVGLAQFIQIAHSIRRQIPDEMNRMLQELQSTMDATLAEDSWSLTNVSIALPISNHSSAPSIASKDTRAILGIGQDGNESLMLTFISAKDAYAINYILCGIVNFQRSSHDQKALAFFQEGLKMLEGDTQKAKSTSGNLTHLQQQHLWRGEMMCYLRVYLAFLMTVICDWKSTKMHIEKLKSTAKEFGIKLEGTLGLLCQYLTGVHLQGTGKFKAALEVYESKAFSLENRQPSTPSQSETFQRDISILAVLNKLAILQLEPRRNADLNTSILRSLESSCISHQNRGIAIAYRILVATIKTNPEAEMVDTKTHLRAALNGARDTGNHLFTTIVLNVMCSRYFVGVVGPQAEKSAQAASATASKAGNPLWKSVADGLLGNCLEVQGKMAESQDVLRSARRLSLMALPES